MQKELAAPKWANEADLESMRSKSLALVDEVSEANGPELMRIVDQIGAPPEKKMSSAKNHMAGRVDTLLKGLDSKSPAGARLLELRATMDRLNPYSLHNAWWFSWMPGAIKRKAVTRFVHKYQPLQKQLNEILNGLRAGKDDLLQTSIEMERQYEQTRLAQREIQSDIHVGELFHTRLEEMQQQTNKDPQEAQKLTSVMNETARRIRDLRTMEQDAIQFHVSIDQAIQSNELLIEQINCALTVGPMVMTNALRIQAALAKQASVQNAADSFQIGLGDLMAQHAGTGNKTADQIGQLYYNPDIALEKLEQGFDQLMQAVNRAHETMAKSTITARETSARLNEMSQQLQPVADGLREARVHG